jgi:hypothetical protein
MCTNFPCNVFLFELKEKWQKWWQHVGASPKRRFLISFGDKLF